MRSRTIPGILDVNSIRSSNRDRWTRIRFSGILSKRRWNIRKRGRVNIEYCRLKIEYLRSACDGSILKRTERSDIHKYSICNLQFPDKSGFTLCYNRLVRGRAYSAAFFSFSSFCFCSSFSMTVSICLMPRSRSFLPLIKTVGVPLTPTRMPSS